MRKNAEVLFTRTPATSLIFRSYAQALLREDSSYKPRTAHLFHVPETHTAMKEISLQMKSGKPVLIFLAVLLMFTSIFNSILKGRMLLQEYRTKNWPHTTGYLVEKKIIQKEFGKWLNYPHIKYDYQVQDPKVPMPFLKRYTNDKIFPSKWEGTRQTEPVREILNQFNYGGGFNVYYNPEEPSESVLIPSIRRSSLIGMVLGIICGIASMWIVFFLRKKYKPSQKTDPGSRPPR